MVEVCLFQLGVGGCRGVCFSYEKQTLRGGVCFSYGKQTLRGGTRGVGGFVSPRKTNSGREGFVYPMAQGSKSTKPFFHLSEGRDGGV